MTRVIYHESAEDALEKGPISKDAERRGQEVAARARPRMRVRTGALVGSLRVEPGEVSGDEVEVKVPADAENAGFPYVIALEFGAEHMPAYPALIPALEEIEDG